MGVAHIIIFKEPILKVVESSFMQYRLSIGFLTRDTDPNSACFLENISLMGFSAET